MGSHNVANALTGLSIEAAESLRDRLLARAEAAREAAARGTFAP